MHASGILGRKETKEKNEEMIRIGKIYKSTHSGNLLIIQGKEKANHTKAYYNQSTKKIVIKRKFLKLVSGKGAL